MLLKLFGQPPDSLIDHHCSGIFPYCLSAFLSVLSARVFVHGESVDCEKPVGVISDPIVSTMKWRSVAGERRAICAGEMLPRSGPLGYARFPLLISVVKKKQRYLLLHRMVRPGYKSVAASLFLSINSAKLATILISPAKLRSLSFMTACNGNGAPASAV